MSVEYLDHYVSPLGGLTLSSDGEALTGLRFDRPGCAAEAVPQNRTLPVFREAERWLDLYFSGKAPDFTPPLRPHGTAFRRAVWEILLTIPYGRTVSYGEIARRMAGGGNPPALAARAVGGAAGSNPIVLIIPCHRVIGADGRLTGYAGGMDRKIRLLRLEGADIREAAYGPRLTGQRNVSGRGKELT